MKVLITNTPPSAERDTARDRLTDPGTDSLTLDQTDPRTDSLTPGQTDPQIYPIFSITRLREVFLLLCERLEMFCFRSVLWLCNTEPVHLGRDPGSSPTCVPNAPTYLSTESPNIYIYIYFLLYSIHHKRLSPGLSV